MVETREMTVRGLRFTVLRGAVGVLVDGEPVGLGGAQQRRLLAALLAEHDVVVSADRLVESIWMQDAAPDGARRTVMTYISRLRGTIGGDHLVTRGTGYELVLDGATYDASDFELAIARARACERDDAVVAYDGALALWSGRAFGDDADEWWLRPIAARLEELRLVALEERAEHLIDGGRHADAVADLEPLVAEQPLRERFVELQMRALYLSGRQAEALRAYQRFHDYLADETGLPPSDALIDLEHRIMLGDASLAPTSGMAVPGYELGEVIGEGAFGAVYRAVQPSVGREVAVKVVRAELADDPRFVQRFEAEAQLVARLEHPHVVPLYDYWRRPGGAFLVFRLLRGGSLSERIAEGPLPLLEVTRLVEEMSGALTAAHALGVVHRDVKPANVLFDEVGNSYLVDFGIATLADAAPDADMRSAGSPMYASPEQARDGNASAASDQYAFGVVAWEALTGRAPFSGTSTIEVLQSKLVAPVPALANTDGIPDALNAVLQRATAPHPEDRYPNVSEFAQAWQRALANAGAESARTTGRLSGETMARTTSATIANLPAVGANPYKGLRAFREADAAEFYGRTELVERLVAAVDAAPFVTVVGPSGSGKSSLVHAGLVPAFRRRGALVVSMVPGTEPFAELEAALRRVATTEDEASIGARLRTLGGLVAVATDLVGAGEQLVLVVDQFEELWTLVDSDATRDQFAALLAHAASDVQATLRVVVTLRADMYDRPLQHAVLGPIASGSTFAVTPMTPGELQVAIVEPAERVGVRFEPGLVATMVGDVVSRPGALPLLQFTLTELFERRRGTTVAAGEYAELGGIGGALASRAEQIYAEMNVSAQTDVRTLFTQLVTPGDDNDDLRRRATTEELATVAPAVIDRYLTNRLLVSDHHPITREPTIEVAHEALLREWPRLREWIDEDRDSIRMRRLITQTAKEWQDAGRDESILYRGPRLAAADDVAHRMPLTSSEREFLVSSHELADRERLETEARVTRQARENVRLRRLVTVVAATLVVSLIAGAVAVNQRGRANDERDRARLATDTALAGGLASRSEQMLGANQGDVALLLALEATRFGGFLAPGAAPAHDAQRALFGALTAQPALSGYLEGQQGAISAVKYSPNGKTIVSSTTSGDLRVWDAATRRPWPQQPPRAAAGSNVAMNDAGLLVTSGRIWDLRTNRPWHWQVPAPYASFAFPAILGVTNVAISEQGLLAIGSFDPNAFNGVGPKSSTLDLWDVNTGRRVGARIRLSGLVDSVAFSHDGAQLGIDVVRSDTSAVDLMLVDTATDQVERRVAAHVGASYPAPGTKWQFDQLLAAFFDAVIFSADDRRVSSVVGHAADGLIATFDATTGRRLPTPATKPRDIMAVSADLREVVDQTPQKVVVADTITNTPLVSYTVPAVGTTGVSVDVALDPTGPDFVYQAGKAALSVLDWTQVGPQHFAARSTTRQAATNLVITPAGRVVDLTTPLHQLIGGTASPSYAQWSAAASASGTVAILTDHGTLAIWDPDTGRIERRLTGAPAGCTHANSIAYGVLNWGSWNLAYVGTARQGRIVLECATTMQSWDLDTPGDSPAWHEHWAIAETNGFNIPYVAISNDTTTIADLSSFASRIADARTGKLRVNGPTNSNNIEVVRVLISPDAHTMATINYDGDVSLVDATTGKLRQTLTTSDTGVAVNDGGQPGGPEAAFSPDGNYFAVWQGTRGLELWDLHTGQSIAVLDGRNAVPYPPLPLNPPTYVKWVNAQATRDMVVSFGSHDDSVTVTDAHPPVQGSRTVNTATWSLRPADWALAACSLVGRDLSITEWNTYIGAGVAYHHTCTPLLDATRP